MAWLQKKIIPVARAFLLNGKQNKTKHKKAKTKQTNKHQTAPKNPNKNQQTKAENKQRTTKKG